MGLPPGAGHPWTRTQAEGLGSSWDFGQQPQERGGGRGGGARCAMGHSEPKHGSRPRPGSSVPKRCGEEEEEGCILAGK